MIGHVHIRKVLDPGPPGQPVLILGPPSVGKWALANHLATSWGVLPEELIEVKSLTASSARTVSELSTIAAAGAFRLFLIELDGASLEACNILLKAMEDQAHSKFILVSGSDPIPTIMSRCMVFRTGYLTDSQVASVLTERNFSPTRSQEIAASSGGQVSVALASVNDPGVDVAVLAALRAIQTRDESTLDTLSRLWTDRHTERLSNLCTEGFSGAWHTFDASQVEAPDRKLFFRILVSLRADVRPKLVVRSSLMAVLRSFS